MSALIVGSASDPHVGTVAAEVRRRGGQVRCLDAEIVEADNRTWSVQSSRVIRSRGWIRRLSSDSWRSESKPKSHGAAVRASWIARSVGEILAEQCDWLSTFADLVTAESKMLQLMRANELGIAIPRTVVSSDLSDVARAFPGRMIVKPLATAVYVDDSGDGRYVPAQAVRAAELTEADVRGAPFVYQEVVEARRHLRIVTVGNRGWACELAGDGLPIDWRYADGAHDAFVTAEHGVARATSSALALARSFHLGHSSQDWVEGIDGHTRFLDLNPSGQWLFLPTDVTDEIVKALADFLIGVEPWDS